MERVCRGADRGREVARSGEACGAEEGGAEAETCGDGDRGRCVCRGRNSGDGRDEASGLRSTPRINKRGAWPPPLLGGWSVDESGFYKRLEPRLEGQLPTQSGPPKSLQQGSPFRQVGEAQDGEDGGWVSARLTARQLQA